MVIRASVLCMPTSYFRYIMACTQVYCEKKIGFLLKLRQSTHGKWWLRGSLHLDPCIYISLYRRAEQQSASVVTWQYANHFMEHVRTAPTIEYFFPATYHFSTWSLGKTIAELRRASSTVAIVTDTPLPVLKGCVLTECMILLQLLFNEDACDWFRRPSIK